MKLIEKLVDIRKSVEYLQKTEKGNQGAKYVNPAILLQKIRSKMDQQGILLFPSITKMETKQILQPTQKNPDNKGFMTESSMVYTWMDGTDTLEIEWYATGKHLTDPAMAFGSALTYSERYFLLKFFQIPTAKDDPEFFAQKTKTPATITPDQIKEIEDLITKTNTDVDKFCIWAGIKQFSEIMDTDYPKVISALKSKL